MTNRNSQPAFQVNQKSTRKIKMKFTSRAPTFSSSLLSIRRIFLCLILIAATSAHSALVAHWNFDETSGNVVHDSTGNHNGTLSATGASFVSGGISGKALNLNVASN